jgi:hypothetical protein
MGAGVIKNICVKNQPVFTPRPSVTKAGRPKGDVFPVNRQKQVVPPFSLMADSRKKR